MDHPITSDNLQLIISSVTNVSRQILSVETGSGEMIQKGEKHNF